MDCSGGGNEIVGMNQALVRELRRGYLRRAPGELDRMRFRPATGELAATGTGARPADGRLEAFYPGKQATVNGRGLRDVRYQHRPGGWMISATAAKPSWSIRIRRP